MALLSKPHFVIGVTGGSGSGKTFFLKCLLKYFNKNDICLISQDDYYIPVGNLDADGNKLHNFDLPGAIDDKQFVTDIKRLLSGETVYKQEYTFNKPGVIPRILQIDPAPLIIVEGLFILHFEDISSLLDMKIFIEADEDIAAQRRIKRDFIERGYAENEVMYKWTNHVMPSYTEYLSPHKYKCDKVIINNTNRAEDILEITERMSEELKQQTGNGL